MAINAIAFSTTEKYSVLRTGFLLSKLSRGLENVSKTQVLIERKMKVMNYFLFLTISFTLIPDYSSLLVVLYFQKVVQVN